MVRPTVLVRLRALSGGTRQRTLGDPIRTPRPRVRAPAVRPSAKMAPGPELAPCTHWGTMRPPRRPPAPCTRGPPSKEPRDGVPRPRPGGSPRRTPSRRRSRASHASRVTRAAALRSPAPWPLRRGRRRGRGAARGSNPWGRRARGGRPAHNQQQRKTPTRPRPRDLQLRPPTPPLHDADRTPHRRHH